MDGDDPRVSRHPARGAGLAQEAPPFGVGVQLALVDFDGHQPVQRLLPCLPDDSEAAPGECAPIRHTGNLRWNGGSHANQDSSDYGTLAVLDPGVWEITSECESQRLYR